ncbi:hypothetical protein [Mesonia aquimarina]|uniref:hypothetical protein n=1 Tax=Mesonia aquimarina TaxID=1504967 RepID=UPI000EF60B2E|nr:hypothetical protein [Mesonia aquimarina]
MKKRTLISIGIRIAIMITAFMWLGFDFNQLKEFATDDYNQTILIIGLLLLVLNFLKNWKSNPAK